MIPIRYCPITIELELADGASTPLIVLDSTQTGADAIINPNTNVDTWELNNVQVECDVVALDNALDNSYEQHLLSGKSLPISCDTFVSQFQTVGGQQSLLVNASRLNSSQIWFRFFRQRFYRCKQSGIPRTTTT